MAKGEGPVGDVVDIKVCITRVVSDHQPTFVECVFDDAAGIQHFFHLKLPVVSVAHFVRDVDLPIDGTLSATVVALTKDVSGRLCAKVDTSRPWDEASTAGETKFVVPLENLHLVGHDISQASS